MALKVESDLTKYAGFTGVGHPDVFTKMPQQPTEKKPGQLSEEKVKEFFEQGFTVAEGFFTREELEPCVESFKRLVDDIAQKLYNSGRVKNVYEDHGLKDRLLMLEKEWPGAVTLLLKLGKLTPEFRVLYQNEKLLNALEQLLGPEIAANPVWNTRPKTPGHAETHVAWHQDSSYFDLDSYKTLIVTSWIAFVDATVENGCMEFCKGGHKKGLVALHLIGKDNFYLTLEEEEQKSRLGINPDTDYIKCPVKAGGIIFFNNLVPHRSIPNRSDHIRWAMDLRYQSPNRPWGLYGMKAGILLRSPDKPDHKPDWDFYDNQDRYEIFKDRDTKQSGHVVDEFDTTLTGPHMDKWPLVGRNRHIDRYFADQLKTNKDVTA